MKTRVITAIVGIIVLIGVMFTFNTLIFNLVIAAITLIAVHEIYSALGFEKKDWLMYAVLVPYTLLVMTSNYQVMRRLVMPMSFLLVTFYASMGHGFLQTGSWYLLRNPLTSASETNISGRITVRSVRSKWVTGEKA